MVDQFIERGTDYQLEHGQLSIYETNCACRDISFYFERNVMTLMLSGHKTVVSDHLKFEFFPGTFFMPEKQVIQQVTIPNATIENPSKCLVLDVDPGFLQQYYEEIYHSDQDKALLYARPTAEAPKHFFSSNHHLIETFIRLYHHRLQPESRANVMIGTLLLKELLLRVFQTEGLFLLMHNFEQTVGDRAIQKSLSYIKKHLEEKITVEQLASVSGLGTTTFFKRFKATTQLSPVDYVVKERIRQAKILILKNQYGLKEIAFKCGFNSYEYFCSRFKKLEQLKPSEFKHQVLAAK